MENRDLEEAQKQAEERLKSHRLEVEKKNIQKKTKELHTTSNKFSCIAILLGILCLIFLLVAYNTQEWKQCKKKIKFNEGLMQSCEGQFCLTNIGSPHPRVNEEAEARARISSSCKPSKECSGIEEGTIIASKAGTCRDYQICRKNPFCESVPMTLRTESCAVGDYFDETSKTCKNGESGMPKAECKGLKCTGTVAWNTNDACRVGHKCDDSIYKEIKCGVSEYFDKATGSCVTTPPAGCKAKFTVKMPGPAEHDKFPRVRKFYDSSASTSEFSSCMWFKHEGPFHPVCNAKLETTQMGLGHVCEAGLPLFTFYSVAGKDINQAADTVKYNGANNHIHVGIRGKKAFVAWSGEPKPQFSVECCTDKFKLYSCENYFTRLHTESSGTVVSAHHGTDVPTDQWNHVCTSVKRVVPKPGEPNTIISIWLNGVRSDTAITNAKSSGTDSLFHQNDAWHVVQLGSTPVAPVTDMGSIFQGDVKELYMWNKTLTDSDVDDMYTKSKYTSENVVLDWEEFRAAAVDANEAAKANDATGKLTLVKKMDPIQYVVEGERRFMYCVGQGRPHPTTIDWYFKGQKIAFPSFKYTLIGDGSGLLIDEYESSLDGEYKCSVSNGKDTVTSTSQVSLMQCPKKLFQGSCQMEGVVFQGSKYYLKGNTSNYPGNTLPPSEGKEHNSYKGLELNECVALCKATENCSEINHDATQGFCHLFTKTNGTCKPGHYDDFPVHYSIETCCGHADADATTCTDAPPAHQTKRFLDCRKEIGIDPPRCKRDSSKKDCCSKETPCGEHDGRCTFNEESGCKEGLLCWLDNYGYTDYCPKYLPMEPNNDQWSQSCCIRPESKKNGGNNIRREIGQTFTRTAWWKKMHNPGQSALFQDKSMTCTTGGHINANTDSHTIAMKGDICNNEYDRCTYYGSSTHKCPGGLYVNMETGRCEDILPEKCHDPECPDEDTVSVLDTRNCQLYRNCSYENGYRRARILDCGYNAYLDEDAKKCSGSRPVKCMGDTAYGVWGQWSECSAGMVSTRQRTCVNKYKVDHCHHTDLYPLETATATCDNSNIGYVDNTKLYMKLAMALSGLAIFVAIVNIFALKMSLAKGIAAVFFFLTAILAIIAMTSFTGIDLQAAGMCDDVSMGFSAIMNIVAVIFAFPATGLAVYVMLIQRTVEKLTVAYT